MTDSNAGTGAYLYRVCAADDSNNCTSSYSNIALGAKLNFTTDATICAASDSPCGELTTIKHEHITELRAAVNAVRSLANLSSISTPNPATGDLIYGTNVTDLRSELNDALVALNITTSSYTDNTITATVTLIKAVHIRELRTRATSGAGDTSSGGTSGGLKYVLNDIQGSTRAVMNNNGSSSAVVARHDYLPFGEEITLRSGGQGYNATDTNRQKYGLTERDATSGLDHTWFRKYENLSGRWTSPDPLHGSVGDPQSFNHYSYAANDPVNLVDPTGLYSVTRHYCAWAGEGWICGDVDESVDSPVEPRDPEGRGGGVVPQHTGQQPSPRGFPCPPTVEKIFAGGPAVTRVLDKTWESNRKEDPWQEEGGWIFMNKKGGLKAVAKNRQTTWDIGDGTMSISLNNPPQMRGWIVVGTFHTHDSDSEPSMPTGEHVSLPNDLWTNQEQRVPGIILGGVLGGDAAFRGYGPNRGYWRSDLPKWCQ
jgi:RHS repeat-associated protein